MKDILDDYCDLSEQLVNFSKSDVYFRKGACRTKCKSIESLLGIRFMENNEEYLGNLMFLNKRKEVNFKYIINKIKNKT